MDSSEAYHIYSELKLAMEEHHLKDAMPRMQSLLTFIGKVYHELREEEIEQANDAQEEATVLEPTASDEEFIAGEDSIDYESESSCGEDIDSSSSDHESGCNCEACTTC